MSSKPATDGDELTLMAVMQRFSTEEAAREYFERVRWPEGPVCPHCGVCDQKRIYKIAPNPKAKLRAGLYKCADCDRQFTVTVGTVMEDSHIPLNKWLIAFYMMCASKTQVSALQLQRQLEIGSYRSAWFMCHRIRFALTSQPSPMDKLHGTVEADEMYVGGVHRGKGRGYKGNKTPVVSLVERGGRVRSHVVDNQKVTSEELEFLLKRHVNTAAVLNTDESTIYTEIGKSYRHHDTVNHKLDEYVRHGARVATTNTVEGFFGNTKRSIDGTHHHVSRQHLPLYLAEFDHKYNTRKQSDGARTVEGIKGVEGKRLTLRPMKGKPRDGAAG